MSEDLTNKLRPSTDDNVWLILKAVQDLSFRAGMSEQKFEDFAEKLDRRLNNTDAILQNVVADIAHLQEGQRRLEERQGRLEEGQGRLEERQGRLEEGQGRLEERQGRLEEGQGRLEERQGRLEEGQESLEEGQKSLRSELTAFRRRVDEQFLKLSGEVERHYREHDQRIARLENNANQANPQT
jgi:chromosome segregation ATPase